MPWLVRFATERNALEAGPGGTEVDAVINKVGSEARLLPSGDAGCSDPAETIECIAIPQFPGAGASECRLVAGVDLQVSSRIHGLTRMLIGPG